MADHIYLKPLTTKKSIIEILAHPQIDLVSYNKWADKTALNLCLKLMRKEFGLTLKCKMIGVDVNAAINITEDREQFKQLLKKK
jgi:carbamoyl-phosphate synthase large subunit